MGSRAFTNEEGEAERLALSQEGLLTVEQAFELGMTRSAINSRVASGRWKRDLPGILRMRSSPVTWNQRATAAFLWSTRLALLSAVSHRSAARLWKLGPLADEGNTAIDLCLTSGRKPAHPGLVIHRDPKLDKGDVVRLGTVNVTKVARTLVDLCSCVNPSVVELCLEDALRQRITTIKQIERSFEAVARPGRKGTASLKALLQVRGNAAPAESTLEVKVLQLIRHAHLPMPTRQFKVDTGRAAVRRIDLAYPARRFAVECDGFAFHSGRADWEQTLTRNNELMSMGWRILHVTWTDLKTPKKIVAAIEAALK
ncbi:MAG: hypothetical protein ABIS18_00055 [Actinomycetota bacterium]